MNVAVVVFVSVITTLITKYVILGEDSASMLTNLSQFDSDLIPFVMAIGLILLILGGCYVIFCNPSLPFLDRMVRRPDATGIASSNKSFAKLLEGEQKKSERP